MATKTEYGIELKWASMDDWVLADTKLTLREAREFVKTQRNEHKEVGYTSVCLFRIIKRTVVEKVYLC